MIKLLIGILLFPTLCSAQSVGLTDKAAHFGISYTSTIISYGIFRKNLKLNKTYSIIAAATLSILRGTIKEGLDSNDNGRFDGSDFLLDSIGTASAIGTIWVFKF